MNCYTLSQKPKEADRMNRIFRINKMKTVDTFVFHPVNRVTGLRIFEMGF
jgi:hypothetical protein